MYPMMKAEGEEKEKVANDVVAAVKKEIEPLLENAAPFFGGSESLTLAEVWRNQPQVDDITDADGVTTGFDSALRDSIPYI